MLCPWLLHAMKPKDGDRVLALRPSSTQRTPGTQQTLSEDRLAEGLCDYENRGRFYEHTQPAGHQLPLRVSDDVNDKTKEEPARTMTPVLTLHICHAAQKLNIGERGCSSLRDHCTGEKEQKHCEL